MKIENSFKIKGAVEKITPYEYLISTNIFT